MKTGIATITTTRKRSKMDLGSASAPSNSEVAYEMVNLSPEPESEAQPQAFRDVEDGEDSKLLHDTNLDPSHSHGTSGDGTLTGATFNFINSILGSGIIALPWAISMCGFHFGIAMLLFVGWLTMFGTKLIVDCGEAKGIHSYQGLAAAAFGDKGDKMVSICNIMFASGGLITYLIIVGDVMPHVIRFATGFELSRQAVVALVGTCIMLPLSSLREMSALAATSTVSVLADVGIVSVVLFSELPEKYRENPPEVDFTPFKWTFVKGFGAMCFAYVCHHSSYLVYNSIRNPTPARWTKVNRAAVSVAIVLCTTLSLGGYLKFFNETEPDVLNNLDPNTAAANLARFFLAITMCNTYPMELFVIRQSVHALRQTNDASQTTMYHYTSTGIIWAVSMAIGLTFSDLAFFVSLVGSISASSIGYIIPPLCFLKLFPMSEWWLRRNSPRAVEKLGSDFERTLSIWTYVSAYVLLGFGIITLVLGTYSVVVTGGGV